MRIKALGPKRFAQLQSLIARFDRESRRCAKAKAYYAACVMQAATLEGLLLAMCDGYSDEVEAHFSANPASPRPAGQPADWTLAQLIRVAGALGWLPRRQGSRGRKRIGDWLDVSKELRNLVHPGKHIRDYPRTTLKAGHYKDSFAIARAASGHLWNIVAKDLA